MLPAKRLALDIPLAVNLALIVSAKTALNRALLIVPLIIILKIRDVITLIELEKCYRLF